MDVVDLRGAVVTLDAMGNHLPLVAKIVAAGGDVVVALKANQSNILEETALIFNKPPQAAIIDSHTEVQKDHGRIEKRVTTTIELTKAIKYNPHCASWPVEHIAHVNSMRIVDGVRTAEDRYYFSTLPKNKEPAAARHARIIRNHWGGLRIIFTAPWTYLSVKTTVRSGIRLVPRIWQSCAAWFRRF
jgi:hypothetical protein